MYWWAYPSRIVLFILLPMYLGCCALDAGTFSLLYKQPIKYIQGEEFWFGLIGLFTFAFGCWYSEPRTVPRLSSSHVSPHVFNSVLLGLYSIVLAAYAIFLFPVLSHPALIKELASGSTTAMYDLRDTLNKIAGVTSLMALQSLCMGLHVGYKRFTGLTPPRKYRVLMILLIIACVLRAWLWSERIALMELAIPVAIMRFATAPKGKKRWLKLAPLFGLVSVFFLFSVGEYFRSWQYYQHSWDGTFISFSWVRFVGYFATSLNNGALTLYLLGPIYFPTNTAVWFYKFPLWPLLNITFNTPHMAYDDALSESLLKVYANEEYNNPGGIFMPFLDYGYALGTLCWLILGFITGTLLRKFVNNSVVGLVLFPVWYIGVLEVLRIFYWGDSRFFPVLVASVLITWYFNKNKYAPVNSPYRNPSNSESTG